MFFYHFLQLCPRGHISENACCNRLSKTRLLSAFGIFQSISCLIRMRLRKEHIWKKNFSQTYSNKAGNGLKIPKALSSRVFKNGYSKHFRDMTSGTKLKKMIKFEKKFFFSQLVLLSFSSTLSRGHISKMLACNRY